MIFSNAASTFNLLTGDVADPVVVTYDANAIPKDEPLTIDEDGDGVGETDPSWYTVTIPATQVLPWEATATNIKYVVASQLKTGDAVKVTVDDADKAYKMTGVGGELTYSLENATFTAPSAVYDAETSVTVKVALDDWKSVAIDSYTDTLTFTAEIV